MNKCFLVLFTLLFILSGAIYGQSPWSLEKCISYAHENNLNIRQGEVARKIADNMLLQNRLSFLPTLNASTNLNINFGNSVDPTTYAFVKETTQSSTYSFTANLPIFLGLQRWQSVKKSKLDAMASHFDLLELREQMSLSITTLYLQILLNKEIVKAAELQIEQTKEQLSNTSKLVDAGVIPEGDILGIEAQLAVEESSLILAQNGEELSLLQLKLILDLSESNNFEIEIPTLPESVEKIVNYELDKLLITSMNNKPAIKSAELKQQSSEKNINIARGSQLPSLSLFTSIRTTWFSQSRIFLGFDGNGNPIFEEPGYGDQLDENLSQSVGLSMSLPIFSGWQKRIAISNAQLDLESSGYRLQSTKNDLNQAVERAYAEAIAARDVYVSKLKTVDATTKSFDHAREKHRLGVMTSLEFLIAKNARAFAESEVIKSKYEYIFKTKVLDFYKGDSMKLD